MFLSKNVNGHLFRRFRQTKNRRQQQTTISCWLLYKNGGGGKIDRDSRERRERGSHAKTR